MLPTRLILRCPKCGEAAHFIELEKFELSCGCPVPRSPNGFADLRGGMSELDRSFAHLYESIAEADVRESMQPSEYLEHKAQQDFMRLGPIKSGKRILEIGPGSGALTRRLVGNGAEVVCVDVTDVYWRTPGFPADEVTCFVADAQALPFRQSFDLVIMTDVLEHVLRPADVLYGVAESLVLGGQVYVRSPANEALASYGTLRGCPYSAVHLRTYSRRSLRAELVASGFFIGRSVRLDRSVPWRFPSYFSIVLRDYLQRRHRLNVERSEHVARRLYMSSRKPVWRPLLSRSIEIWAKAKLVTRVDPLSFSYSDMNYVGLIGLEEK